MVIKDLVPVEWSSQRVLLTAQLAEAYKCSPKNISDNFNRAKEYFEEGVHYFCLTGTALEQFKNCSEFFGTVGLRTRILYLWTYQGCVRHCKMINTPEAWKTFDDLEKLYFSQYTPKAIAAPAAKEKPAVNPKRREGQLSDARVYVLEMSDGSVQIAKIGLSKNIRARAAKAKRDTGSTVKDIYFTPVMSRENARLVEWACHEKFSSRRVKGEFFSVDFAEVCAVVEYFAKLVAAAPIVSDLKRGGKILKLVDRKFD